MRVCFNVYSNAAMGWQRFQGGARLSPEGSMKWYTDWDKITHIYIWSSNVNSIYSNHEYTSW